MSRRNIDKWFIARDRRFDGRWVVMAPGNWLRASYVGASFEDARREFIRRSAAGQEAR
ncbi:hypothetical protein [Streptomyces sp. NBC_00239]|uniref:hypothetical protein n=1 Tax=Streptomyces sp. NBC_00239 TaxID=2903640 RepID=UPI002E2BD450|nr:hypothetical protein [Streptomyces sp. NBC_00239]